MSELVPTQTTVETDLKLLKPHLASVVDKLSDEPDKDPLLSVNAAEELPTG